MRKSSIIDWSSVRLERFSIAGKSIKAEYRARRLSGGSMTEYKETIDPLLVSPHYDLYAALIELRPIVCRVMSWPAETEEDLARVRVTGITLEWISDTDYAVSFRFSYFPPVAGEMDISKTVSLVNVPALVNSLLVQEAALVDDAISEMVSFISRAKTDRADLFGPGSESIDIDFGTN